MLTKYPITYNLNWSGFMPEFLFSYSCTSIRSLKDSHCYAATDLCELMYSRDLFYQ